MSLHNSHHYFVLFILLLPCAVHTHATGRHHGSMSPGIKCEPCDRRHCPQVTTESCQGLIRKDRCDCCPVCDPSGVSAPPQEGVEEGAREGEQVNTRVIQQNNENACATVECPRHQVCILNIQSLPVCRCPNIFVCKRERTSRKDELCGDNGVVYRNHCFLEVEECVQKKNIRFTKGPCNDETQAMEPEEPRNKNSKTDRVRDRQTDTEKPRDKSSSVEKPRNKDKSKDRTTDAVKKGRKHTDVERPHGKGFPQKKGKGKKADAGVKPWEVSQSNKKQKKGGKKAEKLEKKKLKKDKRPKHPGKGKGKKKTKKEKRRQRRHDESRLGLRF